MRVAIMQPYFFPYIGYFQLMSAADVFVLYDDVHFIMKGWINRNYILTDGRRSRFTVPLKGASQNRLISEIEIFDLDRWRKRFLATLRHSYSRAPFFGETFSLVEEVVNTPARVIAELAEASLRVTAKRLGIETRVISSSSVYGNAHLAGQERVIDICAREHAATYINSIGGQSLYDSTAFSAAQIELKFLRPKEISYPQPERELVSNLSIIDVLMFNSPERITRLLQEFTIE